MNLQAQFMGCISKIKEKSSKHKVNQIFKVEEKDTKDSKHKVTVI